MEKIVLAIALSFILSFAAAQEVKEPKTTAEWTATYQPFRIAGNLYYVGTYDLACYLVTTSKGNILINTGLAASAAQIKKNIETLFDRPVTDEDIIMRRQLLLPIFNNEQNARQLIEWIY